jgi:DNA-binding response OmpR family regulator
MASLRALIVDDEEELATALVERLAFRDIDADCAFDGLGALLKMRDQAFDVVVLDLKLPGMGGREVLRRIKKEHPRVPVLLITGHGALVNETEPAPEGAFDYLLKPVQLEDLVAKMREAVDAND